MTKYSKNLCLGLLLFCVLYWLACQSNGPASVSGSARMLNSSLRRTAIFPSQARSQPVLASLFKLQATGPTPSQLAQSYESYCGAYSSNANGTPFFPSIHAAFGSSGLVSLNFTDGSGFCGPIVGSVGGDEAGNPQGYPIILSGNINALAVYGKFLSGNRFRCVDTANSSAVPDNTFVRAYYDLGHDAIVLGSGTTSLAPTCSITVPPGDDVASIWVQWLKS